ncbi:MAG TPA: dihydrofolate reductase family protein [Solirubrobacteraceae bacterium]
MELRRAIPPGEAASPESLYTGLRLGNRALPQRPYVVCNFVSSADGKATAAGRTAGLGGEADRAVFHLLRTQADAILAGTGTLRVERYGVLVRSEAMIRIRRDEGRPAQPLAVIISRSGQVPFEIPLFADPSSRVVLYAPPGTPVPACAAEVTVHELAAGDGALAGALQSLRQEHGVRSLLCEGGPVIFNAMLAEDVVDELFLTLAPTLVGGAELGITAGPALLRPVPLRLEWALELAGQLFLRYVR